MDREEGRGQRNVGGKKTAKIETPKTNKKETVNKSRTNESGGSDIRAES